ncbi:membrane-associated progesterone-binding protein 4 isoform X3 [Cucumis sativus]|uniref:membrane-associated progesterone-binding protein 4 isoform X3 n=1 Tax=Cucumis sativus TaxID=3659 RepID=UPI0012F51DA3|nr:membrane-associated progesterone-binding protein 4 isoform X3 [Cucumis sativus]
MEQTRDCLSFLEFLDLYLMSQKENLTMVWEEAIIILLEETLLVHLYQETSQGKDSLILCGVCQMLSFVELLPHPNPLFHSLIKSVVEWRSFYQKTYTLVGKLVGLYYDDQGNPTKHLKGAEAKAARGAQLLKKQKKEEDKLPSCNSRWSQGEGGEVWCDNGFPRLVQRPLEIALTGKMSKRCACFREDQLGEPGLEVYDGCDYQAKTCRV